MRVILRSPGGGGVIWHVHCAGDPSEPGGGSFGMYIVRVILIPGFNFRPKGGGGVPVGFRGSRNFFRSNYFSGVHLLTKSRFACLFAHPCTTEASYVRAELGAPLTRVLLYMYMY